MFFAFHISGGAWTNAVQVAKELQNVGHGTAL
jgi:hypothetical protein